MLSANALRASNFTLSVVWAFNLNPEPSMCARNWSAAWRRHQMETFSEILDICAGNRRSSVNSPHKGLWRGALMFSLICAWIKGWVNNGEAGDLRRHRAHYGVIVMVHCICSGITMTLSMPGRSRPGVITFSWNSYLCIRKWNITSSKIGGMLSVILTFGMLNMHRQKHIFSTKCS